MVKKAKAAGQFLGGLLNNPAVVIIGLVLGGLFIFRDRISEGFAGIAEGFGNIDIKLPDINLPEINFPEFPQIEFPEFPDFTDIFKGLQDQIFGLQSQLSSLAGQTVTGSEGQDVMIPPDTTIDPETGIVTSSTPPTQDTVSGGLGSQEIEFNKLKSQLFGTLTNLGVSAFEAGELLTPVEFDMGGGFLELDKILQSFNTPFTPPDQPPQDFGTTVIQSLGTEQEFIGGGVGFMGGSVSPTPITTLTQVLDLFPQATASQAANFLAEFSGILPEAALQQGLEVVSLSSAPDDPPQLFNQSSVGTVGISPQELFKLLFPNIISNF